MPEKQKSDHRMESNSTAMFNKSRGKSTSENFSVPVSGQVSSKSRCETPIHPNQVVDGIKFMQVEDPNYITSKVFDECDQPDQGTKTQG